MSALYLYGITRPRRLPARLAAQGISLVRSGERAAVVSPLEAGPVEATRRNLLAHADVVEQLHEHGPVLPSRFGVVLPDRAAALELLERPELERLLEAHRTTCELTLKGTYEESVIADVSSSLAGLRAAYTAAPTFEHGLALGEAVTQALAQRRARDTARVLEQIEPLALDVRVSEPTGELGAFNLAVLTERAKADAVSAALDALAAELSPPLHFKLVGPLPPYSFVDLDLPVHA